MKGPKFYLPPASETTINFDSVQKRDIIMSQFYCKIISQLNGRQRLTFPSVTVSFTDCSDFSSFLWTIFFHNFKMKIQALSSLEYSICHLHGFIPHSFLHPLTDLMLYLKGAIYCDFPEFIAYFTRKFNMEPIWSQDDPHRDANVPVLLKYE